MQRGLLRELASLLGEPIDLLLGLAVGKTYCVDNVK